MERSIEVVTAQEVKDLIARAYLAPRDIADESTATATGDAHSSLGSVQLHPHQISAVSRLRAAIDEFGGALLCDEVGMGKTFVALAVAARFRRCMVVAPAALRDMWSGQARRVGAQLPFLSLERLSRAWREPRRDMRFDLVIIDEAHHLRNPSTIRYRQLSRLVMRSNVLMLSATPIHNSRRDLVALLAVFLGSRAGSLTSRAIGRCVVKRAIESAGLSERIPQANVLVWKELADEDRVPGQLMALPPPVPVRGGGDGGVLIARSLLRQWCSSDAALETALRRRLARSIALTDALASGHYPSEKEISAWTFAEDSVQLAFPSLVAAPVADCDELLTTIKTHENALRQILSFLGDDRRRDTERARLLLQIRSAHPGVPIVAFSQYTATVQSLFRELRLEKGVAALTAQGARVAGGAISRTEALTRFAPLAMAAKAPREIDRIDLLLATDLLSEGINLQDAGVVVHLDLPWTAARLEQRMGRVRRLGSAHRRVSAYGIRPSAAAEALVKLEKTIRAKVREAEQVVGASRRILPRDEVGQAPQELSAGVRGKSYDPITASELIRSVMQSWCLAASLDVGRTREPSSRKLRVAAACSNQNGVIALCDDESRMTLVASDEMRVTDDPSEILNILLSIDGEAERPCLAVIADEVSRLQSRLRVKDSISIIETDTAFVARSRGRALRRISTIVQAARPHQRKKLLDLAGRAREAVLGRLGAAAESELLTLVSSDLTDEEWLEAIIRHSSQIHDMERRRHDRSPHHVTSRLIAVLLLRSQKSDSR